MITLTEQAAAMLYDTARSSGLDPEECLRLTQAEDTLQLTIDHSAPGDRVLEFQGGPVLLVDPVVDETLGDVILDTAREEQGSCLVILETAYRMPSPAARMAPVAPAPLAA